MRTPDAIRAEITALQGELCELERYRYREVPYETKNTSEPPLSFKDGDRKLVLRDDGYRIEFQLHGVGNVDPAEWCLWAEYKYCDLVGPAHTIANLLMSSGSNPT